MLSVQDHAVHQEILAHVDATSNAALSVGKLTNGSMRTLRTQCTQGKESDRTRPGCIRFDVVRLARGRRSIKGNTRNDGRSGGRDGCGQPEGGESGENR